MAAHQAAGERVVFLRNGEIVLAQGADEIALLPLSSLKPAKAAQPEMVMAATAAAWPRRSAWMIWQGTLVKPRAAAAVVRCWPSTMANWPPDMIGNLPP